MGTIRLCRVDDAVRDYWAYHDATCIGEVRARGWGTSELHMADGRYLMRRDDTADALKGAGGVGRAMLNVLRLNARYSLRDGERVLARTERRFSLSTRRDGFVVHPGACDAPAWTLGRPGALRGPWSILDGETAIGQVAEHRGGREFAWHGPDIGAPAALFVLHSLHRQFGAHPDAGGDSGGGE